jgi:hypothetical protein
MKGTSYYRKNKVNLEPYNNPEPYKYLFRRWYKVENYLSLIQVSAKL